MQRQHNPRIWPVSPDPPPLPFFQGEWSGDETSIWLHPRPRLLRCPLIDFSGNSATGWQLLRQFDHDQRLLRLAIMILMHDSQASAVHSIVEWRLAYRAPLNACMLPEIDVTTSSCSHSERNYTIIMQI
jgi:hypothetical protein